MRNSTKRMVLFATLALQATWASPGHAAGLFEMLFGQTPRVQTAPAEPFGAAEEPGLTLRPNRPARAKPVETKVVVGPQPKISIFEDRTLKPGDAVAMDDGIRIFAGSASFPYDKDDFVPIEDAKKVSKSSRPALLALSAGIRYY